MNNSKIKLKALWQENRAKYKPKEIEWNNLTINEENLRVLFQFQFIERDTLNFAIKLPIDEIPLGLE